MWILNKLYLHMSLYNFTKKFINVKKRGKGGKDK